MQQSKDYDDALALVDAPIGETFLIIRILDGLNSEFKDIIVAVRAREISITDFLSFQMVYSMQKIDFGKCFKSAKEDCSCFLHSVFLFSIACARVST